MSDHVTLPIDLTLRVESRGVEPAHVLLLWLELGTLARTTGRVGFLPAEALPMCQGLSREVVEAMARPFGLLAPKEGGWDCRLFREWNRHLDPNVIHNQRKGSLAKEILRRRRLADEEAARELPLLPPEVYRRPDGTEIPRDTVRRAQVLVRLLDNVLRQPSRLPHQIGAGLIAAAAAVVERYTEEQVNQVAVWISHHIKQETRPPALPATAEQALDQWPVLLSASDPEEVTP